MILYVLSYADIFSFYICSFHQTKCYKANMVLYQEVWPLSVYLDNLVFNE